MEPITRPLSGSSEISQEPGQGWPQLSTLFDFNELWMPPAQREPATHKRSSRPAGPDPADANTVQVEHASAFIGAVARAVIEVLTGYRPLRQLTRWLEPDAVAAIASAKRHGRWTNASVTKAQASCVYDDVIDGVAHVQAAGRNLAIAIRLRRRRDNWACTDLDVLLPGSHLVN